MSNILHFRNVRNFYATATRPMMGMLIFHKFGEWGAPGPIRVGIRLATLDVSYVVA